MKKFYLPGVFLLVMAMLCFTLVSGNDSRTGLAAENSEQRIFLPSLQLHQPAANILLMGFDEGRGATNFRDYSIYQHEGACQAGSCPASGVTGRLGNSVKLDGVDDSIQIGHTPTLTIAAGDDLTMEALVFLESNSCGYCRILTKYDGRRGFNLDAGNGTGRNKLSFYASDGVHHSLTRSSQELTLNEWHHLAAVFSRQEKKVRLYIDGVETKYETREDPSLVGELSIPAPLVIGHLPGESDSFQGMLKGVGIYKKALSAAEIKSLAERQLAGKTSGYSRWSSGQALRVLAAFDLTVEGITPLTRAAYPGEQIFFNEAIRFQLPAACADCGGTIYSFSYPQGLEATHSYLSTLGHKAPQLFKQDNLLVQLDKAIPNDQALAIQAALHNRALEAMIRRVRDGAQVAYEPWSQYYATYRGQEKDSDNGRSQRTFDRWEDEDNIWLFGQSTWRYQDPKGGNAPPEGMPSAYAGRELDYYYHYHCEQTPTPGAQDCLDWRIYIELLTQGADDTEIANWARGGWKRLTPGPIEWEVFYKADAFNGRCDKAYIQANYNDAYLLDPGNKVPLLFRLPSIPLVEDKSDKFCAVNFTGYQQKYTDIVKANFWYTTSQMLSKQYDPLTERYVIQARNLYYEYDKNQGKEAVYKLFGEEIYTMRQVKPEEPLLYGLEAFWWGAWEKKEPDRNEDPTWSALQWCRVDYSQGPPGLGKLVCE
jgi:hypothetical protein